jgi:hypothetical protein
MEIRIRIGIKKYADPQHCCTPTSLHAPQIKLQALFFYLTYPFALASVPVFLRCSYMTVIDAKIDNKIIKMKDHTNRQSAVVEWNPDVTVHDLVLLICHLPLSVF